MIRRKLGLFFTAVVLALTSTFTPSPQPAAGYHNLCAPFEVGTPYKTGSNVRGWGDVRCTEWVSQLVVEVELWARNNGYNFFYRHSHDSKLCNGCTYLALALERSCLYGMVRSWYTRVRAKYLLPWGEYWVSGWKQSGTSSFYC